MNSCVQVPSPPSLLSVPNPPPTLGPANAHHRCLETLLSSVTTHVVHTSKSPQQLSWVLPEAGCSPLLHTGDCSAPSNHQQNRQMPPGNAKQKTLTLQNELNLDYRSKCRSLKLQSFRRQTAAGSGLDKTFLDGMQKKNKKNKPKTKNIPNQKRIIW